ncbi:MAG TPA: FlgO family outer membrane protein [Pyrinomonadaceae bacterium]|nr:FlgO family outer membrane protein [Pyrinomonadaceae bacterium]
MRNLTLGCLVCSLLLLGGLPASVCGQSDLERGIIDLSRQISDGLTESQKKTIAVVEFGDLKGRVTDVGRFVAEKLITRLYQTKKFKVIERQHLNRIIAEQKLSLTGMIDPKTAQRLGKLLGVDAIAAGTVTDLGKTLDVNARLINAETGEVFGVASVEIAKDDTVLKLLEQGESAPDTTESSPPTGKKKSQKVDAEFFTFELTQCRLSGQTALCDLVITNHDVERRLRVASGVNILFDEFGNSHGLRDFQIDKGQEIVVLVSGVPTKARITFDGIPTQVTRSPLLTLSFSVFSMESRFGGATVFKVEFRNVALVK